MKSIFRKPLIVLLGVVLFISSCAPNSLNKKATEIAKSFYTEYLKDNNATYEKLQKIKKTYMTDVMLEEIDLRTMQYDADMVTGVQDPFGMLEKMVVTEGENDEWATVTFDMKQEEGKPYRIYEIKLHFRDTNNRRLIDTLDLYTYDVDEDEDKVKNEYLTRWANKQELTDEDKEEMQRMKEYYDELAESGFIG